MSRYILFGCIFFIFWLVLFYAYICECRWLNATEKKKEFKFVMLSSWFKFCMLIIHAKPQFHWWCYCCWWFSLLPPIFFCCFIHCVTVLMLTFHRTKTAIKTTSINFKVYNTDPYLHKKMRRKKSKNKKRRVKSEM